MARTPRHVFISAASSDSDMARRLSDLLQRAGLKTWVSTDAVLPGDNWPSEIGSALERSDALVVLISPAAMQSNWVRREITYALGEERFENRLIPVLVKPTPRSEIPWALDSLKWLKGDPKKVADSLVKALIDSPESSKRITCRIGTASATSSAPSSGTTKSARGLRRATGCCWCSRPPRSKRSG
jgi:hypothetical protein